MFLQELKTVKLVIDKNIGETDVFAQMFGDITTTFSSLDMSKFLEDNSDATNIDVEIRSNGGSVTQEETNNFNDAINAIKVASMQSVYLLTADLNKK